MCVAVWGVALFAPCAARADIILTPADADIPGNCDGGSDLSCFNDLGIDTTGFTLYYKANVGEKNNPATTEEGSYKDSYGTTFDNEPTDPEDATITYTGAPGGGISCDVCYLMVKDGAAHDPDVYVFDIGDWDGIATILLQGFWPGSGAISHASLWGTAGPDQQQIPEPASLLLFGSGVAAAAATLRRRRTA